MPRNLEQEIVETKDKFKKRGTRAAVPTRRYAEQRAGVPIEKRKRQLARRLLDHRCGLRASAAPSFQPQNRWDSN